MAEEETENDLDSAADPHPLQTVANIVLDAMRQVSPEAFANRPKDGASEHDHYLYRYAFVRNGSASACSKRLPRGRARPGPARRRYHETRRDLEIRDA